VTLLVGMIVQKILQVLADHKQVVGLPMHGLKAGYPLSRFRITDGEGKLHFLSRFGRCRRERERKRVLDAIGQVGDQCHAAAWAGTGLRGVYVRMHRADKIHRRINLSGRLLAGRRWPRDQADRKKRHEDEPEYANGRIITASRLRLATSGWLS